ncbi:MAG: CYTH domain-containing protein [Armatimonadota bacterium]|nr:CYTH domain-containing protein [Armatimonadota bacterium]MDR7518474.1 CYTH domain-containing protein [Armatimonadota bacterium]MDR7551057.1 CYTH domain-containing protein [Armatimonadota bacterium]
MPFRSGVEHEVTLVIASDVPEAVAERLADLTDLAGYRLLAPQTHAIQDVHFDTADRALEARDLALRLRVIDGQRWISVKGPPRPLPGGGVARPEFERPWSPDAFVAVLGALAGAGVTLPAGAPQAAGLDAREGMLAAGLEVIQDRETRRVARTVVAGKGEPPLAQVAVDAVVFHLRGVDVRHHEVEIEVASEAGREVLPPLAGALLRQFGPALRVGLQSKLAIGRALDCLLRQGVLWDVLDGRGHLTPGGYDRLVACGPVPHHCG